jgi:hypothetical protein
MRTRYLAALFTTTLLLLGLSIGSQAQTPDGLTPAVEDICTKWGFSGNVNGLCNAYCEAMDCDSANPQASDRACNRVFDKIIVALGDTPFPTCQDVDDDSVPDGIETALRCRIPTRRTQMATEWEMHVPRACARARD